MRNHLQQKLKAQAAVAAPAAKPTQAKEKPLNRGFFIAAILVAA